MNGIPNILTFNILKVLITLIRFNILQLLNKNHLNAIIFSSLLKVFEYDS